MGYPTCRFLLPQGEVSAESLSRDNVSTAVRGASTRAVRGASCFDSCRAWCFDSTRAEWSARCCSLPSAARRTSRTSNHYRYDTSRKKRRIPVGKSAKPYRTSLFLFYVSDGCGESSFLFAKFVRLIRIMRVMRMIRVLRLGARISARADNVVHHVASVVTTLVTRRRRRRGCGWLCFCASPQLSDHPPKAVAAVAPCHRPTLRHTVRAQLGWRCLSFS